MRLRKWMFLLVAFALIVAACGDDDDASTTAATQATTTTTQATTTTAGQAFQTLETGVLTVGSDIPFPPFEDFDNSGNVVGFDAALIDEMANRLGLTVEWVDTDFDTIFTQLALGQFDVVASATTITPERSQQVDFTTPYYKAQQSLTINENETPNIVSVDDLRERDSVAVQTGTTGADWALENLAPRGVVVREFPAAPDTYNALEAGQVTGVIFDEPSAVEESANRPGLKVVQAIDTNEDYGFGVDPNAEGLLDALNGALTAMIDDGTYQTIYDEWFAAPAGSVNYTGGGGTATGSTIPEGWPRELIFGFVPSQEVSELQDDVDTFAGVLADALGIDVTGIVTTDYTGLGTAMGTGQADLGAFGPAGFVLANRAFDNLELLAQSVRFGDATYHGQFFTNDPSICGDAGTVEGAYYYDANGNIELREPTDTPALQVGWNGDGTRDDAVSAGLVCAEPVSLDVFRGKTIAFTTETSTSGYIFPTIQLRNAGIADDEYEAVFSGGHDASVQFVYNGVDNGGADIGVSFDDARRSIRADFPDVGEKVIVFNITSRIANDVIAVRADLPEDLKQAIFDAMATFISTEEGAAVMDELYSWTDLTRADAATEQSLVLIGDAIDELGFSD